MQCLIQFVCVPIMRKMEILHSHCVPIEPRLQGLQKNLGNKSTDEQGSGHNVTLENLGKHVKEAKTWSEL